MRTNSLQKGAEKAGFDNKQIHFVENMQKAQEIIAQLGHPMDIILFENDVPDKYL